MRTLVGLSRSAHVGRPRGSDGRDTSMVGYDAQDVVEVQASVEERSSYDPAPPANVAHQHIAGNMSF
jgi:hypothetical protein